MPLHRLTTATLGVTDPVASSAFLRSFGLADLGGGRFATRDGGEQIRLERRPVRGLVALGLGVDDQDDLGLLAARLSRLDVAHVLDDDRLTMSEPVTGIGLEVAVAPRLASSSPIRRPGLNDPETVDRRDRPADGVLRDGPVRPSNLTHLVLGSPDQPATLDFFVTALGFEISDQLPGIIAFTRCSEVHHNLAVQAAPCPMVHHLAFEVDDVDEVARGATSMIIEDPDRDLWGLGRHAIGSNWFWYLREPSGHFLEYTADIDRISDQDLYRAKEWSGHEYLYAFGRPAPAEFMHPRDLDEIVAALAEG